ncbi:hypothetical protein MLD38_025444 [Melastoma candidum]|uniref:Uncharacterized protein n=1 Tax=Melastoma candidum TaxID=119954 RepID=A0ACB9NVE3_9MYRT|nr:hypothetical protein MLD38_025444 [Melastoma candidum]
MATVLDRRNLPTNYQAHQEHPSHRSVAGAGGTFGGYAPAGGDCYHHGVGIGLAITDLSMAEHESQATRGYNPSDEALESGSKGFRGTDVDEEDEGWLQLSIGAPTCNNRSRRKKAEDGQERPILDAPDLVELDLLPPGRGSGASVNKLEATATVTASAPLLFLHQYGSSSGSDAEFLKQETPESNILRFGQEIHGQGLIGGARVPRSSNTSYPTSSSSSLPFALPQLGRPHLLQLRGADCGAGPSMGTIKIIDPPRRPHSGIWFMLLASQNQATISCLPQIPKSYLRIRDGRMTVRLLTKYLVNKLELDSESEEYFSPSTFVAYPKSYVYSLTTTPLYGETICSGSHVTCKIEITCRGQELQPYLTLQHVRDNIWIPRKDSTTATATSTATSASTSRVVALRQDSTTTTQQHLMVLNYSRRRRITTSTAIS